MLQTIVSIAVGIFLGACLITVANHLGLAVGLG
jgi:hypothetical protein